MKTTNLQIKNPHHPKIIVLDIQGGQMPKWLYVRQLPTYINSRIQSFGKMIFSSFTKTKIEDIQCIACLCDTGPHQNFELNLMLGHIVKNGQKISDNKIVESLRLKYRADVAIYQLGEYQFLAVVDFAGKYIYAWPVSDAINSLSYEHENIRIQ